MDNLVITTETRLRQIIEETIQGWSQLNKEVASTQFIEQPKYLNFKSALAHCRERGLVMSESQGRKFCMNGTWPVRHFGGKVVFDRVELDAWLEENTKPKFDNDAVLESVRSAAANKK